MIPLEGIYRALLRDRYRRLNVPARNAVGSTANG